MNELALFAGAGGGILAGKLLGWHTVCAVELDAYRARRLMQRQNEGHLSPFPIWDDVRTFDGRPWKGIVDVVSGGFPCVDITRAGKKVGIEGEASGLWVEMARIIREVRPRYAYVENAAELPHRGLGRVLADLAELGFDARWGVLGSDDIGADHQRKRTWVVADSMPWIQPLGRDISGSRRQQEQIAWNAHRQAVCEPGFLGRPDGMADRMDRNRAIGDGQDPRVAAAAFRLLSGQG
ncbi:DNA cytosine methyltransferase [Pseudomonas sp. PDM16]|uniref:DNA cytosine methyltransferase n=1 Tax=Pseudomonas sp. PDM16 TaxID=2769292 RepID=UPI0017858F36|nr:DNA cytosine methyltransferase [Pseudomonas sp. PDM16]MBD9415887.1 DNA cytosine methyltransferase [Pseudomonas sp. PDM16]